MSHLLHVSFQQGAICHLQGANANAQEVHVDGKHQTSRVLFLAVSV